MNFEEAKRFVVFLSLHDNRQVDEAVIRFWMDIMDGYTYDECMWALRHHIRTCDPGTYLVPSHLTRIINQRRTEWAMMNPSRSGNEARDAWLVFEREMEIASEYWREKNAGKQSAVDVMDSYTAKELEQ